MSRWVSALAPGILGVSALLLAFSGYPLGVSALVALAAVSTWGLSSSGVLGRVPSGPLPDELRPSSVKQYRTTHPGAGIGDAVEEMRQHPSA